MDELSGVYAVAGRHGVAAGGVRELVGGVANRVYLLGDDLVLRVPRTAEFESDLRKEVQVIPGARLLGVRTPAVVEYDESQALIDAPYAVMERVHGTELADDARPVNGSGPAGSGGDGLWGELGVQLARVHRMAPSAVDGVPDDDGGDPWRIVDELAQRGILDRAAADEFGGWFRRLAGRFDREAPYVLLHGDVAPQNLLVDETGGFAALIDWGDASWGPRGMEFAKLRLEQVAAILPSYRAAAAADDPGRGRRPGPATESATADHEPIRFAEGELEAAALWFHLCWGLAGLGQAAPRPEYRHWTAPPAARLLGALRFFAGAPSSPWAGLG
ncbi:phosphotransferase family enzyme [Kribbella amoyensis]|uniref:Phosphotransferase family enzyme n=1 Tax=Kribbella amoyensis TaxID=996641 RepID=A0A561BRU4_9ACTN|nr:aminoglycoside phosphotransferase family protein [Kribbella amoyensis]TWD81483.1 phosphotransferase family enzyme [Kribbella amoyensis]